jgi:hypothetical protein
VVSRAGVSAGDAPKRRRWRVKAAVAALVALLLAVTYVTLWAIRVALFPRDKPSFSASCLSLGGGPGPCVPGGRIVFHLKAMGFDSFSALAETPEGKTIWFFPGDERPTSIPLSGLPASGVPSEVAVIPGDSTAGEYVLRGVFSRAPLDKDAAREALIGRRSDAVAAESRIRVLVP